MLKRTHASVSMYINSANLIVVLLAAIAFQTDTHTTNILTCTYSDMPSVMFLN